MCSTEAKHAMLLNSLCASLQSSSSEHLHSKVVYRLNIVVGSICWVAVFAMWSQLIVRVLKTWVHGRVWKHRRARSVKMFFAELTIQLVSVRHAPPFATTITACLVCLASQQANNHCMCASYKVEGVGACTLSRCLAPRPWCWYLTSFSAIDLTGC